MRTFVNERLEAERPEAFRTIAEIREQISGGEGSLTDALLQAREEEDASLVELED